MTVLAGSASKGARYILAAAIAGLCSLSASGIALSQGPNDQPSIVPETARFAYSAGFHCGPSSEAFQEGVVTGTYKTAVNLHNPDPGEVARFSVTISRALPFQTSGAIAALPSASLQPFQSSEIECDQLRSSLPLSQATQFRSGIVTVFADRPVDVAMVYSGRPRNGEISTVDVLTIRGRLLCGEGEIGPNGTCSCPRGSTGPQCENTIAKRSGPTFVRLKWKGLYQAGDVVRSDNDCIDLEIENFRNRPLNAQVEFYGTLNGQAKGMFPALSTLPLEPRQTGTISRCLRDFEGDGGASDLIDLAFSATLNARATIFDELDGSGARLDRIFAPTGYFHVEPDASLFVPYTAVLYDDTARRETFAGGDYAGRFGFTLPGGGIYVGDTHPDALYDEGGPNPPPFVPPEP